MWKKEDRGRTRLRYARFPFVLLPLLLSSESVCSQELEEENDIWVVSDYSPHRDPARDLATALERARLEGKRVILEVGGEWCGWCHRLDAFLRGHPRIMDRLTRSFLVLKVNFSPENRNEGFLSRFPNIPGYPHLFVLEADGTLLHSQDTLPLEDGDSYSEESILAFLRTWTPRGLPGPPRALRSWLPSWSVQFTPLRNRFLGHP